PFSLTPSPSLPTLFPYTTLFRSLADNELQPAGERGLDRGLVHLPVPLRRVTVAHFEQGARGVDGNEQRRPGDQLLVVHVPGVDAGRVAAHATRIPPRRHAHAAEE